MNQNEKAGGENAGGGSVTPDAELLKKLKGKIVLIKYGGNAMVEESARNQVMDQVAILKELGVWPVIVHGGGPVIRNLLEEVGIESKFVDGHRLTDRNAMGYVEMALRGRVNGSIVKELNARKLKAVGLSGKDAGMVTAVKRKVEMESGSVTEQVDLGHVGDVLSIETDLILTLLEKEYIPVIAPIGIGEDQLDYNINADMFAGHMAGALNAVAFVALTNVDGLLMDPEDPDSLVENLTLEEVNTRMGKSIRGGMIPKVEACLIALRKGVKQAHIVNGMKPDTLLIKLLTRRSCGTTISKVRSKKGKKQK
ncbi:MAG: acetylglutamate kinase [Balneolaceae bacterium]